MEKKKIKGSPSKGTQKKSTAAERDPYVPGGFLGGSKPGWRKDRRLREGNSGRISKQGVLGRERPKRC